MLAICNPVSAGVLLPAANSRFRLPVALAVLLPTGSACQVKFCGTAVLVPLLNAEAVSCCALELKPALEVAVPVAGHCAPPVAENNPPKLPVLLKFAVVPIKPPVSVPPVSCR